MFGAKFSAPPQYNAFPYAYGCRYQPFAFPDTFILQYNTTWLSVISSHCLPEVSMDRIRTEPSPESFNKWALRFCGGFGFVRAGLTL